MALVDGARILDLPGRIHAAWTDTSRGDQRPTGHGPDDGGPLMRTVAALAGATGAAPRTVAWATQVHGTGVRRAGGPDTVAGTGGHADLPGLVHLAEGDALVSDTPGAALCVLTADCGPLALASPEGVFGAVHAGWRGLVAGVVEAAVARMRDLGATEVVGALGPCIHAGCYEFSSADLDVVAGDYGDTVRATTTHGRPALDLPAGIAAALGRAGARVVPGVDACTACDVGWYSHRARADAGRQALVVWSTPPGPGAAA